MATSEKEIKGWIDLNSDGNKNQNKYWKNAKSNHFQTYYVLITQDQSQHSLASTKISNLLVSTELRVEKRKESVKSSPTSK